MKEFNADQTAKHRIRDIIIHGLFLTMHGPFLEDQGAHGCLGVTFIVEEKEGIEVTDKDDELRICIFAHGLSTNIYPTIMFSTAYFKLKKIPHISITDVKDTAPPVLKNITFKKETKAMSKIKFTINRGSVPKIDDEELLENIVMQFKKYIKEHNTDPEAWYLIEDILISGSFDEGEEGLNMHINVIYTRRPEKEDTQRITIMLEDGPIRIEDLCEQRKICQELLEVPNCCPMLIAFSKSGDDHMKNQFPVFVSIKAQEEK